MGKRSERVDRETLRRRLIGLGERSFRKSYYPELQGRLDELERFRALLDHTRDIILLARLPSTEIVDVNTSACRQLGYDCASLLKRLRIEELVDLDGLLWPDEGCLEEGAIRTLMRRSDGSQFPVELTLCVDRFDIASYLVVVARDISERLKAEEGLKQALAAAEEARDKIDAILSSTADGLMVIDTRGQVALLNQAAEELLGVRASEVIGCPAQDVLRERTRVDDPLTPLLENGLHDMELRSNEKPRILQASSSPIRDRSGTMRGRVISLLDRTRDREIDRMKTEFITTAAHEFRTPLTSIQGFSEFLLEKNLPAEEQREFLVYIHEKAAALGRLVGDLLDIALVEAGQALRLKRGFWSARDLVSQIAPLMRSDRRRHRFSVSIGDPHVRLFVDRDKIGQVLENLLSNAVKYSEDGTLIRIEGGLEKENYRIVIADEGIGMSAAEVSRIFDKFYRADASNRAVGGVGLGMSIARGIVDAHGGRIVVKSRKGQGTSVTLLLPLSHCPP